MKDVLKGTLHSIELFALAVAGIAIGSIPLGIGLAVVALVPASKLMDDIRGNDIKDSIFSVTRSGYIHQNTLARPLRFFSLITGKDKQQKFTEEALNMFTEVKDKDKNGEPIKYNTKSQILTLSLLKKLQRNGYVENLEYKESGHSRLITEKLLLGNIKDIFKSKKHPMYDISFNLTDKERKKEDLGNLAFGTSVKKSTPVVNDSSVKIYHKESRIDTLTKQKEDLIDLKAELLTRVEEQSKKSIEETNNKVK